MIYLKIIFLIAISSTIFAMPAGALLIGGFGYYENGKMNEDLCPSWVLEDNTNYTCSDASIFYFTPQINYFIRDNISIDVEGNIAKLKEIESQGQNELNIDFNVGASYYYQQFYLKSQWRILSTGGYYSHNTNGEWVQSIALGYPIYLSNKVFFDVSYNFTFEEKGTVKMLKYSFKVGL